MDPFYQSDAPEQTYFEPEMMKYGCVEESNNVLSHDPRFTRSGLYSNAYEVEEDNGVLDILAS